ncbi:CHAT domain-containing tetratricopeptide repeat protein [Streptomyces sp. NBC_00287]|uniref:CHAT domain-containing tetratricopeptide repeat protein n=1 Tax=Streptomyces sp. NBC_00287 TaxID=2975702 RepID=UPI002E2E4960|nr:CHAT domain-containing tetratricopeptide repeat protein [Streptomyces sp. NBC_00287]
MAAETAQRADGLLTARVGRYDPEGLVRELAVLRDELRAAGRPAEGALAEFHRENVERRRPFLGRVGRMLDRAEAPGGRDRPVGFPEPVHEPRQLLEREASELTGRGDLDGALAVLRRAEQVPATDPEDIVGFAGLRWHIAGKLRDAGRAREALALLDTARLGPHDGGRLAGEADTNRLRSRFHRLRGLLCDDTGAYEDARHSFREAMQAGRACGDLEAEYHAHTDLAASYLKAGRSREGIREFRRVRAFVEANGGRLVGVLNNLGGAYADAGEKEAARACYRRALTLLEAEGGEGLSMVTALLGLGDLASHEGDEEEAVELYRHALLKSISPVAGVLHTGLPLVLTRLDGLGEAGEQLLAMAEVLCEELGVTFDSWMGRSLFRLAHADRDLRAGRYAEAVADLRALSELAERQAPDVQMRLMVTKRLADALARWAAERPVARQEAFDVLWETRARLLRSTADGTGNLHDRPALVALHHGIYDRLIELLTEHGTELRTPTGRPAPELAFDLHEEYKTWTGGAGHEHIEPARFTALRDWLSAHPDAADCAYVSYFCGHGTLTAFVHLPGTGRLTHVRVPLGRGTLRQAAERLRRTFDGDPDAFPPLGPLPARRPWRRRLDFLADLAPGLLAVLPEVAGRELLCVAADGPVHDLPLHALPLPDDGRPLIERHAVVQVTGATTLLRLAALPPAHGGPAVYVGAVADRDDPEPERLERDADLVAAAGRPVTGAAGIEATPDAVAAGLATASVAHLAAHGWFDPAEPMDSGVFLAHGGRRPARDPYAVDVGTRLDHLLTARRLAREGLRLDLLTLRACSTARRDARSTGQLEGIVQALLNSGVRTVVATHWDVDDTSSRRLFADFHRRLADSDEPPWRALWQAQRAMLHQPEDPWETHPFHWAAPALFGLWRHP